MSMNRREVLQGFGLFGVGLLFRRKGRPETELFSEPEEPTQLPSAAEILAVPQQPFRVQRIVIPDELAQHFVIEDISINAVAQMVEGGAVPGQIFSSTFMAPDFEPVLLSLDPCLFGRTVDGRVRPMAIDPSFWSRLLGRA